MVLSMHTTHITEAVRADILSKTSIVPMFCNDCYMDIAIGDKTNNQGQVV